MSFSYKAVMVKVFIERMDIETCALSQERLANAFLNFYAERYSAGKDVERTCPQNNPRVHDIDGLRNHPELVWRVLEQGPLFHLTDVPNGRALFEVDEDEGIVRMRHDLCLALQDEGVRMIVQEACDNAIIDYYDQYTLGYSAYCPFCSVIDRPIIAENHLAFAVMDKYPVREGHVLVIPKHHVTSFFELDTDEVIAVFSLVRHIRTTMLEDGADGVNFGVNDGVVAGQTIMHAHVHIIPRHAGDVENPRGGVRNFIPSDVIYTEDAPL